MRLHVFGRNAMLRGARKRSMLPSLRRETGDMARWKVPVVDTKGLVYLGLGRRLGGLFPRLRATNRRLTSQGARMQSGTHSSIYHRICVRGFLEGLPGSPRPWVLRREMGQPDEPGGAKLGRQKIRIHWQSPRKVA